MISTASLKPGAPESTSVAAGSATLTAAGGPLEPHSPPTTISAPKDSAPAPEPTSGFFAPSFNQQPHDRDDLPQKKRKPKTAEQRRREKINRESSLTFNDLDEDNF